jgi:hypothetical protein
LLLKLDYLEYNIGMRKERLSRALRISGVFALGASTLFASGCDRGDLVHRAIQKLDDSGADGARNSLVVGGIGGGGSEDGSGGGASGNPNGNDGEKPQSGGIARGLQPYAGIVEEIWRITGEATVLDSDRLDGDGE